MIISSCESQAAIQSKMSTMGCDESPDQKAKFITDYFDCKGGLQKYFANLRKISKPFPHSKKNYFNYFNPA